MILCTYLLKIGVLIARPPCDPVLLIMIMIAIHIGRPFGLLLTSRTFLLRFPLVCAQRAFTTMYIYSPKTKLLKLSHDK